MPARATRRSPLLSRWPIRDKFLIGISLLVLIVGALSCSGFYGIYAYRGLVKSLSVRSAELPLAAELGKTVSDLRVTLSRVKTRRELPDVAEGRISLENHQVRQQFHESLEAINDVLVRYRERLKDNSDPENYRSQISDDKEERATLAEIEQALVRIRQANHDQMWMLDELKTDRLSIEVDRLYDLAAELPSHLRHRMAVLASDVKLRYRWAIAVSWITTVAAILTSTVLLWLYYTWVFRPLRVLIQGSRLIAKSRFRHRIQLDSEDEMSELAKAMNDMTDRFQAIHDDLDRQVRERTNQVVRGEQLASVGFLAAGVAHEINNPLASIALCAESLESRVSELLGDKQDHAVIRNYLKMMQDEAFRCKEITEKLLDFSRMGDVRHQRTELRELVSGVIEMVGHMGRYQEKHLDLLAGSPVFAEVSPQEIKQIVLNLITNGLDSLDQGGTVTIEIKQRDDEAMLIFTDNGCGMTPEVLQHVFEPFFTRRRGGEGTGLGLSISYNIVADHHGHIEAASEGPGKGSQFIVTLPLIRARGGASPADDLSADRSGIAA